MEKSNDVGKVEKWRLAPKPVEWVELEVGFNPQHRWFDCLLYTDCLQHAARRGWGGWSCWWCPIHLAHLKEKENQKDGKSGNAS